MKNLVRNNKLVQANKETAAAVWRLFKGYWQSAEKKKALGLLAAVIGLNFIGVYMVVLINQWYNTFYNVLQNYEQSSFWGLVGQFTLCAFVYIAVSVYAIYLRQMLQINWRKWMTEQYLTRWTKCQTYYRMQLFSGDTDNPDQRISEDINQFVTLTLALIVGFLKQAAMLGSFIVVLWNLSGVITIPLGDGIEIPGYMVWLSIAYAIGGTYLTVKIGNPLVKLNYDQQKYEADFRFHMVRFREYSESVAFYHGENREKQGFLNRFGRVINNYWSLMRYEKRLSWFTNGYAQLAVIFPLIMASPRYFSGAMPLGGLMQTLSAFGRVQDALSFFVDSYTTVAEWLAVVKRLTGFVAHMEAVEQIENEVKLAEASINSMVIDKLDVELPSGQVLLNDLSLKLNDGVKLLVTGASGCGKSTLLRTMSGIWPFGKGSVVVPQGQARLFLPQKPYIPLGSLREAITYPGSGAKLSDEQIRSVMDKCCLSEWRNELDRVDDWARVLSLGEQQRLAFARVILLRPQWIFLDEASSALDEPTEKLLYEMLQQELPQSSIISIGHRSTLFAYHEHRLHLDGLRGWTLNKIAIK